MQPPNSLARYTLTSFIVNPVIPVPCYPQRLHEHGQMIVNPRTAWRPLIGVQHDLLPAFHTLVDDIQLRGRPFTNDPLPGHLTHVSSSDQPYRGQRLGRPTSRPSLLTLLTVTRSLLRSPHLNLTNPVFFGGDMFVPGPVYDLLRIERHKQMMFDRPVLIDTPDRKLMA